MALSALETRAQRSHSTTNFGSGVREAVIGDDIARSDTPLRDQMNSLFNAGRTVRSRPLQCSHHPPNVYRKTDELIALAAIRLKIRRLYAISHASEELRKCPPTPKLTLSPAKPSSG